MVKMGYTDFWGLVPSLDAALDSPSSPRDLVESQENEMDPNNECATPRSDDRGSGNNDGNGVHLMNTLSQRRRHMSSSPTGTELISEFDAIGDAMGSESSLSPLSFGALELDGVLHLDTPVAMDNTIIMEGELLDDNNEPSSPFSTTRSASLIANNRLGTSSNAGSSTSIENNGPGNRIGARHNTSNGLFPWREEHRRMYAPRNNRHYEVGSSSQQAVPRQWQGVGLYPSIHLPPGSRIPPNMNFPPLWVGPGLIAGLRVQMGAPLQGPVYHLSRRSSGLYPPPSVTIRHPPTRSGGPPLLPEQPRTARVTITAPPASERASLSAPEQSEATPLAQKTEQLEARSSQPILSAHVPAVWWPPIAEEDALYTERLHGPSRLPRRLPVFQDICPGDVRSQLPLPPPLSSQPPSPPPLPSPSPPPPPPPPPSEPPLSPPQSP